jgi:hypothetical protein
MVWAPGIKEEQVRLFVGPQAEYYLKCWEKMQAKGTKNSGNLSVFLVGIISIPAWLLYRKMYRVFAYYAGFVFLLSACDEIGFLKTDLPGGLLRYSNLLALIFFSIRGNYIYKCHVVNKLKDIISTFKDDHVNSEISKQGGTSIIPALIIGLVITFFSFFAKQLFS